MYLPRAAIRAGSELLVTSRDATTLPSLAADQVARFEALAGDVLDELDYERGVERISLGSRVAWSQPGCRWSPVRGEAGSEGLDAREPPG